MVISLVVIFSLSAAISWGISDFSGGVGSKKLNVLYVLTLSQIIGILSLFFIIFFTNETFYPIRLIWPILGGVFGGIGLISLYRGLAIGKMIIVAPVSAVISTSIPIIYSINTEGLPSRNHIIGFAIALVSIILLSANSMEAINHDISTPRSFTNLFYGISSGIGFGLFFILINQFESGSVYWPLVILRFSSITFFIILILITKPSIKDVETDGSLFENWKIITIAGIGDTLGNVFFTLATQRGRLDIAAVISSLFPLVTIFLAWMIFKETIFPRQKIGIIGALGAVVLFST